MGAMLILKRAVLLAILLLATLQLGGAALRAEKAAGRAVGSAEQRLPRRLCREIGFPHSNVEACRLLMRVFG